MKPTNGLLIFVCCIILSICSACSSEEDSNASLIATHNETEVPIASRPTESNATEDTQLFQRILQESDRTIPYVKLGETIRLNFGDQAPQSFELSDYLLGEEGTLKYRKAIRNIEMDIHDGIGDLVLDENGFAALSSNSKDYEPGATLRGFRMICNWKDHTQEYAFVIRTDAFKR